MQDLLIHNATIYADAVFDGWILVRDGKIADIGTGSTPQDIDAPRLDARGNALTAGWIDVHVHGAVGHDVMDASTEGLCAMARFFASKGVTAFAPTTLTSSHEKIMRALQAVQALPDKIDGGATVVGVHLEGPYLNVAKCGAQNPDHVRLCHPDEARHYLDSGVVRMISLAPEFPENHWLIEQCAQRGITASIAHTSATYQQAQQAIADGVHHSTHTFNAMTGLHHREPGVVGAVLTDDRVTCELIADNIHVHAGAMRLLWQVKGRERTILISDAMRATGMPDGPYLLEDLAVQVTDGRATLSDGTLAGSVLTLDVALRNMMQVTGASLQTVLPALTSNPAQALGIEAHKGQIAIGKDADFVLLDDALNIQQTIVMGRVVYQVN
ncbi:MAG: N-acetylglucosamine-6-phosphate deacetylase [Anaerolineae bacterium]